MAIVREPIKDTVRDEVDRVFKEITDRIITDLAEELDYWMIDRLDETRFIIKDPDKKYALCVHVEIDPVGIEYTHYNEKEDA